MTKIEVAFHQLKRALHLFARERDYICAITLAGAAEEILGRTAQANDAKSALDEDIDCVMWLLEKRGQPSERVSVQESMNYARNALKHRKVGDRSDVQFDARQEAECIIDRAVTNYRTITGHWPDDVLYDEYLKARKA